MLENFGFRVLAEVPIELGGPKLAIHDCLLDLSDARMPSVLGRAQVIEGDRRRARGPGGNDAFNQLNVRLDPRPVVWLRAWFRYMRQTGVAFPLRPWSMRCAAPRRRPPR